MNEPAVATLPAALSPPVLKPGRGLVFILGALTVIGPFAIDMYLPALPQIGRALGADIGTVQLTLSVFLVGIAVGQALFGPIVDRWGRRRPLLLGLLVYVAACVGCAVARSIEALLAWRLVMALGCAASSVVPRAVVRDFFNERDSARMYSLLLLILSVSPIFAPSVGSQLIGLTGWRGIFWMLAALGAACMAAVAVVLPETAALATRRPAGLDAALRTYARLLRDRRFLGAALVAGLTVGAIFSYLAGSSFVLIELYGLSPQQYALAFALIGTGLIVSSQVNRWLVGRFHIEQILGTALAGAVLVGFALAVAGATGWGGLPVLLALLFLNVSAGGFIGPNIAAVAMAPFGEVAGSASALLGTIQSGVSATAAALVAISHNGTAVPMTAGITLCALTSWIVWHTLGRAARATRSKA